MKRLIMGALETQADAGRSGSTEGCPDGGLEAMGVFLYRLDG
jgi:hypothetical protein